MLRINKVKVEIISDKGRFGFEAPFFDGINFIASKENTCGKSSVISAIYYGLGMEELLGGQGKKVLPSVYKSELEYGDQTATVMESAVYLEITNAIRTVTIYRTIISINNRQDNLVTIYESSLPMIYNQHTRKEDYYIHGQNSATSPKGFFTFLEEFLHMELPEIPTIDGPNRKLYLQLIFSAMFIEQKQGWSGILARTPNFGIREVRKRIIEYIINLDVLKNEKRRELVRLEENEIKTEWKKTYEELETAAQNNNVELRNLYSSPHIYKKQEVEAIHAVDPSNGNTAEEIIRSYEEKYLQLKQTKPVINAHFDELQEELTKVETEIAGISAIIEMDENSKINENALLLHQQEVLEQLKSDLSNNQDAAKLKKIGSALEGLTFSDICPVCHQPVSDSLLIADNYAKIMTIDENIAHLKAQISMVEFAICGHKANISNLQLKIAKNRSVLFSLRTLAKSIRNDITSVDPDISETIVRKKIQYETCIANLHLLIDLINNTKEKLMDLTTRLEKVTKEHNLLPKKQFSDADTEKQSYFRKEFVADLKYFGYKSKSISDDNKVSISLDTYMPMIENFDIRFDSSASDNIRVIWAYTLALLQTSEQYAGNHPGVIIFDEPDQHSIVSSDIERLFETIICLNNNCQVIIGITVKDTEIAKAIDKLDPNRYHRIDIIDKAIKACTDKDN